jgi:two-component system, cell cycle sensor histidine kinase and response regulator CckA
MEMLERGPTPDLVITDVRMPRVSGPELVRAARRKWPRLRVLFVSGHTGDDTPDGFLQAGDRLLGKPFTAETLLDLVRDLLSDGDGAGPETGDGSSGDRHLQAVPRSV